VTFVRLSSLVPLIHAAIFAEPERMKETNFMKAIFAEPQVFWQLNSPG
jgi:hypothetical protein